MVVSIGEDTKVKKIINKHHQSVYSGETRSIQESMISGMLDNPNPLVRNDEDDDDSSDDEFDQVQVKNNFQWSYDGIDEIDVYEAIRDIKDPEHPYSLEELKVVKEKYVRVFQEENPPRIVIYFKPTVKHCTLVNHIGLCIREKLKLHFKGMDKIDKYKIDVFVRKDSHQSEKEVNKQINDKERMCAALENPLLLKVVNECIKERDI